MGAYINKKTIVLYSSNSKKSFFSAHQVTYNIRCSNNKNFFKQQKNIIETHHDSSSSVTSFVTEHTLTSPSSSLSQVTSSPSPLPPPLYLHQNTFNTQCP